MSDDVIRILIIEDEPQIKKFLRISLEAQQYRVSESRLGADGLVMAAQENPDLIILDLGLPDMDGIDVIKTVREWSELPIIVLSVRADESEKVRALDAGANDYVTKPFGIAELMARIRVVLRSNEQDPVSPTRKFNDLLIDMAAHEVYLDSQPLHLSRKEFELLRLVSTKPGQIFTHQYLLKAIWGEQFLSETHYLRVLVRQLRQKLGETGIEPKYIETVQGVGYRLKT